MRLFYTYVIGNCTLSAAPSQIEQLPLSLLGCGTGNHENMPTGIGQNGWIEPELLLAEINQFRVGSQKCGVRL